jgi:tetratricopeptide (TPR) repeat protein
MIETAKEVVETIGEDPEVSRRGFLGLEDADAEDDGTGSRSGTPDGRGRPHERLATVGILVLAVTLLTVGLLAMIGTTAATAEVSNGADNNQGETLQEAPNGTAEQAMEERQAAERWFDAMAKLEEEHPEIVDEEVVNSVSRHLDSGDSSFQLGKYAEAEASYQRAAEQARGALRSYYEVAAEDELKIAAQTINQNEDRNPGQAQELQNRHEHIEADLENATTASEFRSVYERAATLHTDSEALEPDLSDRLLDHTSLALVLALIVAVLMIITLWARGRAQETREEPEVTAYNPDKE